jgi:deoxyribodipyrimidine photo-lyase
MGKISIFWFRRDLRLHDNHGLYEALKNNSPVLPIFIFDKNILDSLSSVNDARVSFIHQTLFNINQELQNKGSALYILYGDPLTCFKKLCEEFEVEKVFTNHDYEPYALKRDKEISVYLKSRSIQFNTYKDQVIFEKSEVIKADGTPYTIFTPYSKIWKSKYTPSLQKENFPSENHAANFIQNISFHFPTIQELGFAKSEILIPAIHLNETVVSNYDKTRNIPALNGTSRMSVHLRFGTVSIREFALKAYKLNEQWLNELIWREFFMMILFHFPHVIINSFKSKYDNIKWRNDETEFEAWCKGETGYPIVDAGMRELNETGFMHNRVRMIVASFLTKHLLIDWRWGEAYFAEKLLDFELSSNNGNWQWAAGCGCDAAPYFRIFNPWEQTKKFDPEMIYINNWLGDIKNYTNQPIVEHEFARKRALDTFKKYLTEYSR